MEAKREVETGAGPSPPRQLLTILMPARNEEANLPRAYDEVTAALAGLPLDYEVLVIDNDSSDGTGAVAAGLCARDRRWRYLKFSRDFGVEASCAAGLRYARGDAALVLFSDLQDPPAAIPEFVRLWQAGHDVVYGVVRRRQGDPLWKRWSARLAYRLISRLADVNLVPDATDFRLLSRRAIDALNRFDERNRYLRGFAHWIGFRQAAVPYDRRPRIAGQSKAPFLFLLNFVANAVTCLSIRPVQLFTVAGVLVCLTTLGLAAAGVVGWLFGLPIPGPTATHFLLLANLAAVLLGVGTLGEYVGRTYVESKRRPLFLVDRSLNVEEPDVIRAEDCNERPARRAS
jgi:dolichol-phosphate mannosyltransferase